MDFRDITTEKVRLKRTYYSIPVSNNNVQKISHRVDLFIKIRIRIQMAQFYEKTTPLKKNRSLASMTFFGRINK